ncbi:MAG: SHOCT domain-containing protein [Fimbriimonas sp.]
MTLRRISSVFYFVGIALVLGSWVNVVTSQIGWLGWVIAMLGWGAQFLPSQRRQSVADEIQKLQALRESGALDDVEFEMQKEKLLNG